MGSGVFTRIRFLLQNNFPGWGHYTLPRESRISLVRWKKGLLLSAKESHWTLDMGSQEHKIICIHPNIPISVPESHFFLFHAPGQAVNTAYITITLQISNPWDELSSIFGYISPVAIRDDTSIAVARNDPRLSDPALSQEFKPQIFSYLKLYGAIINSHDLACQQISAKSSRTMATASLPSSKSH